MGIIVEVKIKELARLKSLSYNQAAVLMRNIRDYFDKKPQNMVTPANIAEYFDIPEDLIIKKLKEKLNEK